MTAEESHYRRWHQVDCIRRFAEKGVGDFFETERRFLARIMPQVGSVLDIGCASGRLRELLLQYRTDLDFAGIDIVPESIERARKLYPDGRFWCGNALEFAPGRTYDLVNATGVCQHEPRFADLLSRMWSWSDRYMLFDVKLAAIDAHLVDITRCYAGRENRLYFVVLSLPPLIDMLRRLPNVAAIAAYGYVTAPNAVTTVPPELGEIVSAGFLLERGAGEGLPALDLALPDFLSASTGQPSGARR